MSPCPAGSMIQRQMVHLLFGNLGFQHVGLYLGQGQVVHFDGEASFGEDATIKSASLHEFARGLQVTLRAVPRDLAHGRCICREARRLLALEENGFNHRYDLLSNNCEHFALHCYETGGRGGSAPLGQVPKTALDIGNWLVQQIINS